MQAVAGVRIGSALQDHEDALSIAPCRRAVPGRREGPGRQGPETGRAGLGQRRGVFVAGRASALPDAGDQDDQGGEGADHNGVDERLQPAHHAFPRRFIGLGGGMDDGGRAIAGL